MHATGGTLNRRVLVQALGIGTLGGLSVRSLFSPRFARARTDEQEDAGLVGPGEYESPDYGYVIEWDDRWDINPDPGLAAAEVDSDDAGPTNALRLWLVESNYRVSISFSGRTLDERVDGSPDEATEAFVTSYEEFDWQDHFEAFEILANDFDDEWVEVLTYRRVDGNDLVVLNGMMVVDGDHAITISLSAQLSGFRSAYEAVVEGISLDRDAPYGMLSDRDIEAGVDTAAELASEADDGSRGDTDSDREDDDGDVSDPYLADVRDHYETLAASVDRFIELLGGDSLSDAEITEITTIIDDWSSAPDVAAAFDAPADQSEVEEAYLAYTDALHDAAVAFMAFLDAEQGSTASERAQDDFGEALASVASLGEELDAILSEAGA